MTNIEINYDQQSNNILIRDSLTGKFEKVQRAVLGNDTYQEGIFITDRNSIAAHIVVQIATA